MSWLQLIPILWLKRLKWLAIGYLLVCGTLWLGQERLLFWPSAKLARTPEKQGLAYEDVWLSVAVGNGETERLHGWWIPGEADRQAPVLLYLHHNAVNVGANLSQAKDFHDLGYSVLLIDYRGFGRSEGGYPTESRVYQDADAAWNYLTQTLDIAAKRIIIYGHSMGSAIAIDLAARQPQAGALIVQNGFTSLRDMTKRFGLFWLFPMDLLLRPKFDSFRKIDRVAVPVLFVHGMRDPQIPYSMSQRLFAAAAEPKQLLLLPEEGHDNNMGTDDLAMIDSFVRRALTKD